MSFKYKYLSQSNDPNSDYNGFGTLVKMIRKHFKTRQDGKRDAGLIIKDGWHAGDSGPEMKQGYYYKLGVVENLTLPPFKMTDDKIMGEVAIQFTPSSNFVFTSNNVMWPSNSYPYFTNNSEYVIKIVTGDGEKLYGECIKYGNMEVPEGRISIEYKSTDNTDISLLSDYWLTANKGETSKYRLYYCFEYDSGSTNNQYVQIKGDNILNTGKKVYKINKRSNLIIDFDEDSEVDLNRLMSNVEFDSFKVINIDGSKIKNKSLDNMFYSYNNFVCSCIDLSGINLSTTDRLSCNSLFEGRRISEDGLILGDVIRKYNSATNMFKNCITKETFSHGKLAEMMSIILSNTGNCYNFTGMFAECDLTELGSGLSHEYVYYKPNNNSINLVDMFKRTNFAENFDASCLTNLFKYTDLYDNIYMSGMFDESNISDCSNLILEYDDKSDLVFTGMFRNCKNLRRVPTVKLGDSIKMGIFDEMFSYAGTDCGKLYLDNLKDWTFKFTGKDMNVSFINMFLGMPLYRSGYDNHFGEIQFGNSNNVCILDLSIAKFSGMFKGTNNINEVGGGYNLDLFITTEYKYSGAINYDEEDIINMFDNDSHHAGVVNVYRGAFYDVLDKLSNERKIDVEINILI